MVKYDSHRLNSVEASPFIQRKYDIRSFVNKLVNVPTMSVSVCIFHLNCTLTYFASAFHKCDRYDGRKLKQFTIRNVVPFFLISVSD